ncbi:DNA-directed RNA polymerase specialized sigma subunit [Klebsiella oxytoca]|nr:DNA-directed RNA polymerase specialized sigma subunit [Klebsiella oxytoca]
MKNGIATPSRLISALDACRTKLKAFIRARIPQRDEADDILQEVTYQLIRVEQPVENIAAWLFRAARNEMTDRARKKRELPLAGDFSEEEEGGFPEDELAETLFGVAQTPEEAYLKNAALGGSKPGARGTAARPARSIRENRTAGLQLSGAGRRDRRKRAGAAVA